MVVSPLPALSHKGEREEIWGRSDGHSLLTFYPLFLNPGNFAALGVEARLDYLAPIRDYATFKQNT